MSKFKPGQTGNPRGRPVNTSKIAKLRSMLEPHSEDLVKKAVSMALEGDTTALRLCLERLVPAVKPVQAPVTIPALSKAETMAGMAEAVIHATAAGKLAPDQATTLISAVASLGQIKELSEFEERLKALEGKHDE